MIERLMLERFASPRIQLPDDEHEAHNDHWDLADENQPRDASSGAQNLPCHDPCGEEPRAGAYFRTASFGGQSLGHYAGRVRVRAAAQSVSAWGAAGGARWQRKPG